MRRVVDPTESTAASSPAAASNCGPTETAALALNGESLPSAASRIGCGHDRTCGDLEVLRAALALIVAAPDAPRSEEDRATHAKATALMTALARSQSSKIDQINRVDSHDGHQHFGSLSSFVRFYTEAGFVPQATRHEYLDEVLDAILIQYFPECLSPHEEQLRALTWQDHSDSIPMPEVKPAGLGELLPKRSGVLHGLEALLAKTAKAAGVDLRPPPHPAKLPPGVMEALSQTQGWIPPPGTVMQSVAQIRSESSAYTQSSTLPSLCFALQSFSRYDPASDRFTSPNGIHDYQQIIPKPREDYEQFRKSLSITTHEVTLTDVLAPGETVIFPQPLHPGGYKMVVYPIEEDLLGASLFENADGALVLQAGPQGLSNPKLIFVQSNYRSAYGSAALDSAAADFELKLPVELKDLLLQCSQSDLDVDELISKMRKGLDSWFVYPKDETSAAEARKAKGSNVIEKICASGVANCLDANKVAYLFFQKLGIPCELVLGYAPPIRQKFEPARPVFGSKVEYHEGMLIPEVVGVTPGYQLCELAANAKHGYLRVFDQDSLCWRSADFTPTSENRSNLFADALESHVADLESIAAERGFRSSEELRAEAAAIRDISANGQAAWSGRCLTVVRREEVKPSFTSTEPCLDFEVFFRAPGVGNRCVSVADPYRAVPCLGPQEFVYTMLVETELTELKREIIDEFASESRELQARFHEISRQLVRGLSLSEREELHMSLREILAEHYDPPQTMQFETRGTVRSKGALRLGGKPVTAIATLPSEAVLAEELGNLLLRSFLENPFSRLVSVRLDANRGEFELDFLRKPETFKFDDIEELESCLRQELSVFRTANMAKAARLAEAFAKIAEDQEKRSAYGSNAHDLVVLLKKELGELDQGRERSSWLQRLKSGAVRGLFVPRELLEQALSRASGREDAYRALEVLRQRGTSTNGAAESPLIEAIRESLAANASFELKRRLEFIKQGFRQHKIEEESLSFFDRVIDLSIMSEKLMAVDFRRGEQQLFSSLVSPRHPLSVSYKLPRLKSNRAN